MGANAGAGTADFAEREHSMQAESRQLREAREFAAQAAADFGCDARACHDVKLAMSEAVSNAIEHGSSAASDPIRISVAAEGPALVFDVLDTGRFESHDANREPLSTSGRGLVIMRTLMDDVLVRPGADGTLTRLVKRCA